MKFKESELQEYSKPLSNTEKEKCKHAISRVKDALINAGYVLTKNLSSIDDSYYLELRDGLYANLTVIMQGSYANNTNIRQVSDVDISVVYNSIYSLDFSTFKGQIYDAITKEFRKLLC